MVPVQKSGGVRIYTDFKRLNATVKRKHYILLSVEDIMHHLKEATVFSKLAATSAFFKIPLDKATAKLITFITPCGQYFYHRLPQGISSALEIFQRTMENILHDQQDHVICFFDDILVLSKSESEHTKHLKDTCIQLHNAGKKLNREKCESRNKELRFLSFIISKDGVKPDPQKTEAILHMPDQMAVSYTHLRAHET